MKFFLVWKIYLTFLHDWLIALFYKSNFMEKYPLKHPSNKFFLLCCRHLHSNFNGNMLYQRGLDKYFQERFLLVSTI